MTSWIIQTLVATTVLMLLVLIIRRPVSSAFGARAAYLLWLAPALRLALPPLPDAVLPQANLGDALTSVSDVVVVIGGTSSLPADPMAAPGGGSLWLQASLGLWLTGAAFFMLVHLAAYWRYKRRVRAESTPLFTQNRIQIFLSDCVTSPIALGVLNQAIIVPNDFGDRFDAAEQRLALAHETVHHQRGDLAINMAALTMLALHWWNPIAHIAHRAFRLDQEAACDARVLAGASGDDRAAYGTALYKSATGGLPLIACAMGSQSQLKARLQRILADERRRTPVAFGFGLASVLVLTGVGITASSVGLVSAPALAVGPRVIALGGVTISRDINASRNLGGTTGLSNDSKRGALIGRSAPVGAPPRPPVAPSAPLAPDVPSPPEPPVVPEAPMAPVIAEAPSMPTFSAISLSSRCGDGTPVVHLSRVSVADGHTRQQVAILVCPRERQAIRTHGTDEVKAALASARASLADDPMIEPALRTNLVALIDRQIDRLTNRPARPAPFPAS